MIEILPNWHPFWVHFAIAMSLAGAGIYVIFGWKQITASNQPITVARWMLWMGALAAWVSLLTGYWASTSVTHDDLAHANIIVHRNWAIGATVLFTVTAALEYVRRKTHRASPVTAAILLVAVFALLVTGKEGAENVYEHGLGVKRLPDVSDHEHDPADPGHIDSGSQNPGAEQEASDHEDHSHVHATSDARPAPALDGKAIGHPAEAVAQSLQHAIATGDVGTIKRLLDADVVIFESGRVEEGLAEYEKHHMKSDIAFMKEMNIESLSRKTIDAGDMAVVISRTRITGLFKNREIDLASNETLVMRNRDGEWKIEHVHWSSSEQ